MADSLSFPFLEGAALTGAITFMYDRVSAALDRRASRKAAGRQVDRTLEMQALAPNVEHMTDDQVRRFTEYAAWLRDVRQDQYLNGGDADLRRNLGRIREELEDIYGIAFVFEAGERPTSPENRAVVKVFQSVETVDGQLRGARAKSVSKNADVRIVHHLGTVSEGAEVTGLDIDGTIG